MGGFDFDTVIKRENTASVKWEQVKQVFGQEDVLPMWVADMDFNPPHQVAEAIRKRLDHEIFGYSFIPDSTGEAIQNWLRSRHGWEINPAWIAYCTGVVPAISTAIQAFTEPGDKVLLQSPVYHPFFHMVEKNGRVVANSPLILEDGRYEIDWEQFEARLKEGAKLYLNCNPHNPGGRVWEKDELVKMADLCAQYGCLFLSDEIHSDLVYKPYVHTPIASLGEKYRDMTITCIAPTKTFNLAGLKASAVIIPNPKLRKSFQDVQAVNGTAALNTFGIIGMEAAYRYGASWLEELLQYLAENIEVAAHFIKERLPVISDMKTEGTYLMWLDCRGFHLTEEELKERLWKKAKLGVEIGSKFGPGGEGFIRMNIACPRETLMDGLSRLEKAFS
ncbi:MalY/PatB family protein [Heyndrickxia acidiproducens]|uniref:MalY/PatB family protein n=1 Tax=Heyndrickxia acidiproducens TaxID=1121084 RepID=UPI00036F0842|nr:MalY/PatB family protein [Heyndrickxia acidiproducens]